MKKKKILYAALVITALSTASVWKASAASVQMPNGTVVIGNKAFDITYANDTKNLAEITAAIVASSEVYVKGFDATWINNSTNAVVASSTIPSVTYKNTTGVEVKYAAGDNSVVATEELEVISIE
ncbi:hypothetical protein LGK97_06950 [Clostridium sp. CS001]|uniref:hypothetical protein n=1 Tax=Clostridium sp. CS001 TaxID=2880648 RepID=UPI001CF50849|nr:hypothetical protein [Clostridium sp. CS001]MCB2289503.1 hypothetical protein [Clostridium sp. CS001]